MNNEPTIKRQKDIEAIETIIRSFPVTAILGPRQCGKTTLAREFSPDHFFDLENPRDMARFANPQLALEDLKGLIVIDEIQLLPELFALLRYLVDQKKEQKYLILGSASPVLIKKSGESLAGRIAYYHLGGFGLEDVDKTNLNKLWTTGGFPRSFLAESENQSLIWRENYITTFLSQDIPQLGISIPAHSMRRFWMMLSHYHGQVINFSELARSFSISDVTVRKYIDILEGTFMVRVLHPWHTNLGKRLVKRPKIYLRDSGIFHSLQAIGSWEQLLVHPKLGASWEGFAQECVISSIEKKPWDIFFWSTHSGAEVDLFWQHAGKNWAIEFKYSDAPKLTKSMRIAIQDLLLEHLWIVYPGKESYRLEKNITVIPLHEVQNQWIY